MPKPSSISKVSEKELKKLNRIARELGTVQRVGLTEQLVQKFESLVLKGSLSPGEQLPPERHLAEMLSVSRASLRQALKALQVMGVLEVRQGSGNYLSESAKEILQVPPGILVPLRGLTQAELFEVRRAMEAESAATAAERATPADLESMRVELAGMKANKNDRAAYGKYDLAFHNTIAAISGNRFFIWFLALANKVLYQALLIRPMKKNMQTSIAEHENILAAIEAGDSQRARVEMLKHVSYKEYYHLDHTELAEIRFLTDEPSSPEASPEDTLTSVRD